MVKGSGRFPGTSPAGFLEVMTHGSLFSGIGGFDLAAQWMGWDNIFHCEWNEFGQKVLKYYWPNAESFTDITKTDFTKFNGTIDILSGGFPCQPFSTAGKRQGSEDDRYLWPEMLRAIQEIKPTWVVGENVPGLLAIESGLVFERVCAQMENEGYEVQPVIIPACATGAPHRRDRIWFTAHSNNSGSIYGQIEKQSAETGKYAQRESRECPQYDTNYDNKRMEGCKEARNVKSIRQDDNKQLRGYPEWDEHWLEAATRLCVVDDGLSRRLDGITLSEWRTESLKAAGNAIVPQVAYEVFKAIEQVNNNSQ